MCWKFLLGLTCCDLYRWFLLANAIICAYSVLAAIASLIGMCIPWGPLSVNPLAWLTFLVDFVSDPILRCPVKSFWISSIRIWMSPLWASTRKRGTIYNPNFYPQSLMLYGHMLVWKVYVFVCVQLLVNALMSAAASATEVAYIGYRGQSSASWAKACPAVGSFCRRVAGALVASYIAWIFLALSTLLAVTAIHNTRRRINS